MGTPRLNLTAAQAALIYHHALRLSRPAPVMPGDVRRLAENPRDEEAVGRLRRWLRS